MRVIDAIFFLLSIFFYVQSAPASTQLSQASATFELQFDAAKRAPGNVTLPYNWDSDQGGVSGKAHFTIPFPADPSGPQQALFIRRVGNSFEIAVNGELLATAGVHGDPHTDSSIRPRMFLIPRHLLRAENTIAITIGAVSGRNAGLGLVYAGGVDEIRELYEQAYRWRNSAYRIIFVISAILGVFVFLLWWRQRENLYLYFALSELAWAVHIAGIQFETLPISWLWWGIVNYSCYAISSGFIAKFSLVLIGKHDGWIKRAYAVQLCLSVPVMTLAIFGNRPGLVSLWLALTILLASIVAFMAMRQGFRAGSTEQRVLAVAIGITLVAALRDMLVFRILPGYGGFPWLVFAWTAFGITMAWIISERLHRSAQSIAGMNRNLALRLRLREEELGAMFESQSLLDRQQAIIEERQRIMRDMHDGLGSQLVRSVQLAKNPLAPRAMLTEQLLDALDNLKLTVDAMQDTDGDIAMLLGSLRYRLSPRFEAVGVSLSWDVPPLPVVQGWTIQKSRHLQLILFEAISNVITHAQATRAHLSVQHRSGENMEEQLIITLEDNGVGFRKDPVSGAGGQGLANIRSRAASIGAELHMFSSEDGTQLKLTIAVGTGAE